MSIHHLTPAFTAQSSTQEMPMLFVGHGNPMNALEENEFVAGWQQQAQSIAQPSAILCVSAHWETRGTQVTTVSYPQTIHDFGGFPRELYGVQYPAPGSPALAAETQSLAVNANILPNENRGLDHGCWSVLKHLYPEANIPVVQLSLNYLMNPAQHYEFAKELSALRRKGVLTIGSGNIVHNLRTLDWGNKQGGFDWAISANNRIKELILSGNHSDLINYSAMGKEINLSIPTPEHYLPLLYILGMKNEDEEISLFNDRLLLGSLSMTSVRIG